MTLDARSVGASLRRWRSLHRVKQAHAAELFGVAQSTISRWETGEIEPEPQQKRAIADRLAARLTASADRALADLVKESPRKVHLICNISHRLLAASSGRSSEFGRNDLIGESLWPFATDEIREIERKIASQEPSPGSSVSFETGWNTSKVVMITPSLCRWSWLTLSDGAGVRLVETIG